MDDESIRAYATPDARAAAATSRSQSPVSASAEDSASGAGAVGGAHGAGDESRSTLRSIARRLVPADVKAGLDVVRAFAYGDMRCRVEEELLAPGTWRVRVRWTRRCALR